MLLPEQFFKFGAHCLGAGRGPCQKTGAAVIRRVVLLDEVPHVDLSFPIAACKAFPCFLFHMDDSLLITG